MKKLDTASENVVSILGSERMAGTSELPALPLLSAGWCGNCVRNHRLGYRVDARLTVGQAPQRVFRA